MINTILILPILISFFTTFLLLPNWIKRAHRAGLVGKDLHKSDRKEIAESGGMNVVAGFCLGLLTYIAINTFLFKTTSHFIEMLALLSTLLLISFVAFTDDILGWKIGLRKRTRIILVVFATIPLVAINAGKSEISLPFFGIIDAGIFYPIFLIPLGILGATTTFNFLAGYNGLEAGQGILLLAAIAVVAHLTGNTWLSLVATFMVAALLAFLFYNFYPAKVFPGDSLTYSVGGLVAITAILGNFEKIAVFFFIPYILETFLKVRGGLVKQSYGKVLPDCSLDKPYEKIYGLEHVAIVVLKKLKIRPTELKVVLSIWSFQTLVIIAGFIIFGKNII